MRKLALALLLFTVAVSTTACATTPNAGEVGVIRNGKAWYWPFDWFDNHKIRGIVANGSGNTWTGLGSDVHYYPVATQQRFFRLATCGDDICPGADGPSITVPTSDGVEVTISGTFFFNTAFDGTDREIISLRILIRNTLPVHSMASTRTKEMRVGPISLRLMLNLPSQTTCDRLSVALLVQSLSLHVPWFKTTLSRLLSS
jgi:hypothetical protein